MGNKPWFLPHPGGLKMPDLRGVPIPEAGQGGGSKRG